MDDVRVGMLYRAVRQRRGWRQADVARLAGTSQPCISRVERGELEHAPLATIRRIAKILEIDLTIHPRWHGGDDARLLDARHAALVERCAAWLRRHGWTVRVEYTFSVFGERGSVDIVAWLDERRAVLIVEVKGAIVDLQDLVSTLDRKTRLVPALLADPLGWRPAAVGRLVYAPATSSNRTIVGRHRTLMDAAFPARGREARTWLDHPSGDLSALWLTRPLVDRTGRPINAGAARIRAAHGTGG